jgi:hypothetical protein
LTYVDIDAGTYHSVARRDDGLVVAWGLEYTSQCNVPRLPAGNEYVEVSAGREFSLARADDGTVVAWGANTYGQCNVPPTTAGLIYVEIAAGGVHGLALRKDGTAAEWGALSPGLPGPPQGHSYREISAGQGLSAALLDDGSHIFVSTCALELCNVPVLPTGMAYVEIATGDGHLAARRSDGAVLAWGYNISGQCDVPTLPPGLSYVEIAAGTSHTLARRSDGSVVAWGLNDLHQCDVPDLPLDMEYSSLTAGQSHSVAMRSDGAVVGWGDNTYGQCVAPAIPVGMTFVEIAAGWRFTMARTAPVGGGECTPVSYCTAKLNSLGCLPSVHSTGTPLATSGAGFWVEAVRMVSNNVGLLCIGTSGRASTAFQGGTLCVAAPIHRTPVASSGGNPPPNDCSGVFSIDMNRYAAGGPIPALRVAGTVVNCQWWGRDPGFAAPNNTTLSDGLEYSICP